TVLGDCRDPYCWPTFYCVQASSAMWEQDTQDATLYDTGSGLTCNFAGDYHPYIHTAPVGYCPDAYAGGGPDPCANFDYSTCPAVGNNFNPDSGGGPPNPCCATGPTTPIIIDIADHGFNLTDAAHGVLFDIRGDLHPEQVAWTAPGSDDAFLCL